MKFYAFSTKVLLFYFHLQSQILFEFEGQDNVADQYKNAISLKKLDIFESIFSQIKKCQDTNYKYAKDTSIWYCFYLHSQLFSTVFCLVSITRTFCFTLH